MRGVANLHTALDFRRKMRLKNQRLVEYILRRWQRKGAAKTCREKM